MRSIVLSVLSFQLLSCASGPPDSGGVIEPGDAGAGGGGTAPIGGPDEVSPKCDCLPDCALPEAEVEEGLCDSAGTALVMRERYDSCGQTMYSKIAVEYATSVVVTDGDMAGCIFSAEMSPGETRGEPELRDSCEQYPSERCSPCIEFAFPPLVRSYAAIPCE